MTDCIFRKCGSRRFFVLAADGVIAYVVVLAERLYQGSWEVFMPDENAVRCAADFVCRALRSESAGTRAVLPFDPSDRDDSMMWLRAVAAQAVDPPGATTSYVTRRLVWAAKGEARKARRRQYRLHGKSASVLGLDALDAFAERPPPDLAEDEAVELWVTAAVEAARELMLSVNGLRAWRVRATLACLARATAEVGEVEGDELAHRFVAVLCSHPLFKALPISQGGRAAFSLALIRFRRTGNVRRDLASIGFTAPRLNVWEEFLKTLQCSYTRRAA